jgi:hypothetical protein
VNTNDLNAALERCKLQTDGPILAGWYDAELFVQMAKDEIDITTAIRFLAIAKHLEEHQ